MGINTDAVQRLYVAYFNRPADPAGLAYWESQLSSTVAATQVQLEAIASGFSGSAEYAALYAGQTNAQIIDSLYMNLFSRHVESTAVLNAWVGWLTDGTYTFAQIALQLTYSAQGTDATAIANKLAASTAFTAALDTAAEIAGYAGTTAAAMARTWLASATVDGTTHTTAEVAAALTAATASVATTINSIVTTSAGTTDGAAILRADAGVSTKTGADGVDDTFVAVGVTAAGQYTGSDANFTDLTTINSNADSELDSGDAFAGGTGYDTLHIYGTADLAGVNLTSIERVVLHSDVAFTSEQLAALNTAGATIAGDGASIMRMEQSGGITSVDMSNINLQAIGQFDLAASLTAQISQLGLDQIGTVAAGTGAFVQAAAGTPGNALDFTGKTVYGPGSVKDVNGTLVSTLDAYPGVTTHLNLVVTSVAAMVTSMNTALAAVPGYSTQDTVNLTVADMSLYIGSQTEVDVIMAGSNHAFLRGGAFGDTLIGGSGTNFISGAAGNDTITGGVERDFFAGDEGDDTINGLGGNDFINGQGGADTITGGAGLDFIMPGDDADTVVVDNTADFISLYSSTNTSQTDGAADTVKFVNDTAVAGLNAIVGFEAASDVLKFESASTGAGITGISAAAGNATISAAGIVGFNMNTATPGGILILMDTSFIRGDVASANHATMGYDAVIGVSFGTVASAGVGHLIAVGDGGGNTNIFYDSDGSTTANNWQLAVKLIGVSVSSLAATSLQLMNES